MDYQVSCRRYGEFGGLESFEKKTYMGLVVEPFPEL